jgi:hypothetical protein
MRCFQYVNERDAKVQRKNNKKIYFAIAYVESFLHTCVRHEKNRKKIYLCRILAQTDKRQKRANLDGIKPEVLQWLKICLYLRFKWAYFAFKISNKGFTYLSSKTGLF